MKLYYCGFNAFGQYPIKDFSSDSSGLIICKLQEYPIKRIKDVAFSWSYVVIISENGLYVSGFVDGKPTQLKKLEVPNQEEVVQVSASEHHALLTTASGECLQYRPLNHSWKKLHKFTAGEIQTNVKAEGDQACDDHIVKVCCGERITAALSANGRAYAIPSPLYVPEARVIDVACGLEHGLLLTESGHVYSWGVGSRGQLGHGELESEEVPREVNALAGVRVIHVAAGGWHSATITECGDMYTWGWNHSGQLGFLSPETASRNKCSSIITEDKAMSDNSAENHQPFSPSTNGKKRTHHSDGVQVSSLPNDANICSTDSSSTTEMPSCKKHKTDAEGDRLTPVTILSVPTLVDWPGGADVEVKDVACGARHTAALLSDNTVWGCGWNAYGQLGESLCSMERSDEMRKIDTPNGRVSKIFCEYWSTGILMEDSD